MIHSNIFFYKIGGKVGRIVNKEEGSFQIKFILECIN